MAKANAKALSHTRPAVRGARGTEVTESSKFAQGAEVSQNARKQARLFSSHSCLPSMPVASSAGSPLRGPLERLGCRGHLCHSEGYGNICKR